MPRGHDYCKCGLTQLQHEQAARYHFLKMFKGDYLDAYDHIFALGISDELINQMSTQELVDSINVRLADLNRAVDQAIGRGNF